MIELEAGWWAMMGQEGQREMCGFEGHGYGSVRQRCCEDNVLFNVGTAPPLGREYLCWTNILGTSAFGRHCFA